MSIFMWGRLATIVTGLVAALVFTNLDLIEAIAEEEEAIESKRPCKGPCA